VPTRRRLLSRLAACVWRTQGGSLADAREHVAREFGNYSSAELAAEISRLRAAAAADGSRYRAWLATEIVRFARDRTTHRRLFASVDEFRALSRERQEELVRLWRRANLAGELLYEDSWLDI
jgi:hypothetical protein